MRFSEVRDHILAAPCRAHGHDMARPSVHMHFASCSAEDLESRMDEGLVDLERDLSRDPGLVA